MSLIYCHTHNRHWDSDFAEECPVCARDELNTLTRRTLHRAAFHQCVDRIALEREACEHALRAALIIYGEPLDPHR